MQIPYTESWFFSFDGLIRRQGAEIETENFSLETNAALDNGHCTTFFLATKDSKGMHFIYDYGNYNWKEMKEKGPKKS